MSDGIGKRQADLLSVTIRHVGRAMRSLERVGLPEPSSSDDEWLWSLYRAQRSLAEASDHLIDGIEQLSPTP